MLDESRRLTSPFKEGQKERYLWKFRYNGACSKLTLCHEHRIKIDLLVWVIDMINLA